MIVDRLEVSASGAGERRTARVRWEGGELELTLELPEELAGGDLDASPYVAAALLPAMRRGEDLEVDGPVSPELVRASARVRELYGSWDERLAPVDLRVAEEREPERRSDAVGCFFSRGVDSTYSAAVPRAFPGPLDRLVFVDGLEPAHDERVRAQEVAFAGETAEAIGLPLSVVRTNLRELTDPVVEDWEDMAGAGLAFVATSLGGGLGDVVIPSTDGSATLGPCGTSPLLDPLFSTVAVRVHHDSVALGRVPKTLWLARERPDLVRLLKVCWMENSSTNCGRCAKCLATMAALVAGGALERAEQFPDEIDLDALREQRPRWALPRVDWSDIAHALDPERHGELRAAVVEMLRSYPLRRPAALPESTPAFRRRHAELVAGLLRHGGVWPPLPDVDAEAAVGLVRVLDPPARRHRYGVGSVPAGELVGELGALRADGARDAVALRITPEGYLVADGREQPAPDAPAPARLRWALAPLTWRDVDAGPVRRVAAVAGRAPVAATGRRRSAISPPTGPPLGFLHREGGPDRVPLHSAIHPVVGDQLLTTNRFEATDLGYGEPDLLGWLDARAPVTGRLGTRRARIPWASRFGLRFRDG